MKLNYVRDTKEGKEYTSLITKNDYYVTIKIFDEPQKCCECHYDHYVLINPYENNRTCERCYIDKTKKDKPDHLGHKMTDEDIHDIEVAITLEKLKCKHEVDHLIHVGPEQSIFKTKWDYEDQDDEVTNGHGFFYELSPDQEIDISIIEEYICPKCHQILFRNGKDAAAFLNRNNQLPKEIKKAEELKSTKYLLISNSQNVKAVKELMNKEEKAYTEEEDFLTLFVIVGEGDYNEIWGIKKTVIHLDTPAYRIR
jgi:hypothetical protein